MQSQNKKTDPSFIQPKEKSNNPSKIISEEARILGKTYWQYLKEDKGYMPFQVANKAWVKWEKYIEKVEKRGGTIN